MPQPPQRPGLVLVLRPALFGDDEQPRRVVPQPDGAGGLVPLLTTRPAGPVVVHRALGEQPVVGQVGPGGAGHLGLGWRRAAGAPPTRTAVTSTSTAPASAG